MNAATFRIPESLVGDPSDVAVALEVAGALWDKGEGEEAIRWLRRAVTSASDADDAVRAARLASAAADLEEAVKLRQGAVQPAASHAPAGSAEEPPPPDGPKDVRPEAAAPSSDVAAHAADLNAAHSDSTTSATATDPAGTPAAGALTAAEGDTSMAPVWAAGHVAHAPPSATNIEASGPPVRPSPSIATGPSTSAPAPPSPSVPAAATLSGFGSSAPRSMAPAAPRSNFAKPPTLGHGGALAAALVLPPRMRVSVKSSVRDAGLLFVRALADGEIAPQGTLEAFLVRADEGGEAKRNANGGTE